MYAISTGLLIFCFILTYFAAVIIYLKTILFDIKSIINRIDRLSRSKDKGAAIKIFLFYKEAIDLHTFVYKYLSFNLPRVRFFILFAIECDFQLRGAIGWCDEYRYFHNGYTVHRANVLLVAFGWNGKSPKK